MSREVKGRPDEEPEACPDAGDEDPEAAGSTDPEEEVAAEPTELEIALAAAEESQNRYLRTAAELDNFRKRTVRIRAETRDETLRDVLLQVAPLLDNFRRALGQESQDPAALRQGIEIIFQQFNDILTGYGLEEIEAEGRAFDPNQHEAMMQVPSEEHPPGTVMQEMEKGYRLNGRVIRPSRVLVSTAPVDDAPSGGSAGNGESGEAPGAEEDG